MWHWVSDMRINSWFCIGPRSFTDRYSSCGLSRQKYVFVVLLQPLIGLQKQMQSSSTQILRTSSRKFPARCRRSLCCSSPWPTYCNPWEIVTHEWKLYLFTETILTFHSIFTLQVTSCNFQHGPNFGVPSNRTFWVRWFFISWQSVLTTCHWFCKLWELFTVFCHEVLSVRHHLFSGILHENINLSLDLLVRAVPLVLGTFAINLVVQDLRSRCRCFHQKTC